jgi:hypothetical protein
MTTETNNIIRIMFHMAQTYERLGQTRESQAVLSALHFALDQVSDMPRGEERAQYLESLVTND